MSDLTILHCYTGGSNKLYAVRIDYRTDNPTRPFAVVGCYGAVKKVRLIEDPKGNFAELSTAQEVAARLVAEKERTGYVNLKSSRYQGRVDWSAALAKIDTSRLLSNRLQESRSAANNPMPTIVAQNDEPADRPQRHRRALAL